ncbi:MAG: hypothetical protein MRY83_13080 [Flavobacteriales bacterium]|nr:hypothetical protein [Flavobacteriales bacterium]
MNSIKSLAEQCEFDKIDPKEGYAIASKEEVKIRSLYNEMPNLQLEEGWLDYFFQYFKKLTFQIYEYNAHDGPAYNCPPYYELSKSLWRLLWECMKKTSSKLESIRDLTVKNLNLIRTSEPKSVVCQWLIRLYFEDRRTLSELWNLNGEEESEIFLMFRSLLEEFKEILLDDSLEDKDRSAMLGPAIYIRNTIQAYRYRSTPKEQLDYLIHELNLLELIGYYPKAFLGIRNDFKRFYNSDSGEFSLSFDGQNLNSILEKFKNNKKTSYIILLTQFLLKALNTVGNFNEELKSHQKSGANILNSKGVQPLSAALECLAICTDESEQITAYLSPFFKEDLSKTILSTIINDNYYELCESPSGIENGKLVKLLVQKVCDTSSEKEADIELTRLLVRWGLESQSMLPKKYQIQAPETLPDSVDELKLLIKRLKLKSQHISFNKKPKDKEIDQNWPENIKKVFDWKNGSDQDEFCPISEHSYIKEDIKDSFENHLEDESEVLDDFEWPEVDLRKHIHEDVIPIGQDGSGDAFFVDPKFLSKKNKGIVFRLCHDVLMTGRAEANSLEEFIGKILIKRCISAYGPDPKLKELLQSKVEPNAS